MSLNGTRVAGVLRLQGAQSEKLPAAGPGDVAALARMEGIATGTVLSSAAPPAMKKAPLPRPVYGLAVHAEKRADDVKLTPAVGRLVEEDPTLMLEQNADLQEMVLWGQGDIHLQIAMDRLKSKHNLAVASTKPQVPYKETIKRGAQQHSRFKRQSGGHGQFADIQIEVKPLPRGTGHTFIDSVVGGAIPRNYIPAVEEGVMDYLHHGPLELPGRGRVGHPHHRPVPRGRQFGPGVQDRGAPGHAGSDAEMRAGAARAHPLCRDLGAERLHLARAAHRLGPARPAFGLRRQARLGRLGPRHRALAALRDARPHRRIALGDARRRARIPTASTICRS